MCIKFNKKSLPVHQFLAIPKSYHVTSTFLWSVTKNVWSINFFEVYPKLQCRDIQTRDHVFLDYYEKVINN